MALLNKEYYMHVKNTIHDIRLLISSWKQQGLKVAFVPTMGNLHHGHIELVKTAQQQSDKVIVSIFVNPTQFGANEDFSSYPRTLAADCELLAAAQCDAVFAPSAQEMYPDGRSQATIVSVSGSHDILCGKSRPGHFDGVATVVSKLFNIVQADKAFFGEKDYQQLAVIRRFSAELCFPIEIIGVPTVRAEDGLALSSRNGYLSPDERQKAPIIYQTLKQLKNAICSGQQDYSSLTAAARLHLQKCGFEPDYIEVLSQDLSTATTDTKDFVILVAAKLGKTRLIDNLAFSF